MKDIEALSESLVKWLKVSRGLIGDQGSVNCPLCKLYFKTKADCTGCPIKKHTGKAMCSGTPYVKWIDHHHSKHGSIDTGNVGYVVECSECKEFARDVFYYILDIIERDWR